MQKPVGDFANTIVSSAFSNTKSFKYTTIPSFSKQFTSPLLNVILVIDDPNIFRSGNDLVQLSKDIIKQLDTLGIWFV